MPLFNKTIVIFLAAFLTVTPPASSASSPFLPVTPPSISAPHHSHVRRHLLSCSHVCNTAFISSQADLMNVCEWSRLNVQSTIQTVQSSVKNQDLIQCFEFHVEVYLFVMPSIWSIDESRTAQKSSVRRPVGREPSRTATPATGNEILIRNSTQGRNGNTRAEAWEKAENAKIQKRSTFLSLQLIRIDDFV
ncbi:hypothetical protein POM88_014203 [Heracleum sosnowskyi]|uniref:Uncharacterized protein n=1 Tax=Heracleum sosnowskyi TaxID=360622 RepID=A0AAD8N3Z8_9APIA|nr:hypothetical protein POM88_014203 [Heracleum sosnowskyi]